MPILYTLTPAQNGTRVRLDVSGTDIVNVRVGDPSQVWANGTYIEIVRNSSTAPVYLIPFDGTVTLNILSGTSILENGEYARVSQVYPGTWDLHVYKNNVAAQNEVVFGTGNGTTSANSLRYEGIGNKSLHVNTDSPGALAPVWLQTGFVNAAEEAARIHMSPPNATGAPETLPNDALSTTLPSDLRMYAGASVLETGGRVIINAGDSDTAGGGSVDVVAGSSGDGNGGDVFITAGNTDSVTSYRAGTVTLSAGSPGYAGPQVAVQGGYSTGALPSIVLLTYNGDTTTNSGVVFSGYDGVNASGIFFRTSGAIGFGASNTAAGDATSTAATFAAASYGSAGQVLASRGDDDTPEWVNASFKPAPLNTVTSALTSYDLGEASQHNTHYRNTAVTLATFTVLADASVTEVMPNGGVILVGKHGTGNIVFVAAPGVTINTPDSLSITKLNGKATLIKVAPNTWDLEGNLAAV